MSLSNRWSIAVAGVFLQMALGAVYACPTVGPAGLSHPGDQPRAALHVIAAVMAVSALLPIVLSPPASDRARAPSRTPSLAH